MPALRTADKSALTDVVASLRKPVFLAGIPLVPVDAASARAGHAHPQLLRKLRGGSIAATLAALFGIGVAASALADGPAVSGPNARIAAGVGATDGDATGLVFGSATVPLDDNYGAQVDGLLGAVGDDAVWGVGGHLFWRDPDKGLLGVVGSYIGVDDHDSGGRFGVEGELYSGQFTTIARGGYQVGEFDDGGFGSIDLRWYGTDDFMLSGGGAAAAGDFIAKFGAEYQPGLSALPSLSVFADAEIGDEDADRIFFGLRFYVGGETKSLIRRHREDDPTGITDWFWIAFARGTRADIEEE